MRGMSDAPPHQQPDVVEITVDRPSMELRLTFDDGVFGDTFSLEADPYAKLGCGPGDELPDRVLLPGGDDEVLGVVLLQHQPLHLDIVLRVAPVAERVDVAHVEAVLEPLRDIG